MSNADLIRQYLHALETFRPAAEIAAFFHPEVRQVEHPNRMNPKGGEFDLAALLKRIELGQKLLRQQAFTVHNIVENGSQVAVEASWSGVVDVPLGAFEPGAELRAHVAMFFDLENGRIRRQRSYDCFAPAS